ncbi:MAG: Holliday junction ATP-dependent DNA helicase RuvA [Phycisphaerae bacterium]|nr:Holliday junction ATP-dependent DNA helicase RuvA [Phycisphaerae bacterium]
MICRLSGRVAGVGDESVTIDVGPLCYELLVPAAARAALSGMVGRELTLHTVQYLDGNPSVGNLLPRMIGFLSETDRAFFWEFVKVKSIGMRKALRAMSVPTHQLAAAIEQGDERTLATLPEVGKRTAAQIIAQLHGRLAAFLVSSAPAAPPREFDRTQRVALEILMQWGDRRADAERWLTQALELDPGLSDPEALVRAAYRVKQAAGT